MADTTNISNTTDNTNTTNSTINPSTTNPDITSRDQITQDTLSDTNLLKTLRSNGIYQNTDMDYNDSFYRIPRNDPFNLVDGGKEYIFFTKPDLNLFSGTTLTDEAKNIPFFRGLINLGYGPFLLKNLTHYEGCPFIKILSNRKVSNVDIPDIQIEIMQTAQNMYGTKLSYPKTSMKSDDESSFTVEFEDTRWMEIYILFKTWDQYDHYKWMGQISPLMKYRLNKILHDQIAVYKFIVDSDGETILHYSKGYGIFPTMIGRSAFSDFPDRAPFKMSVTFHRTFIKDLEPEILSEFNHSVINWIGSDYANHDIPIWDNDIGKISGENINYFYIKYVSSGAKYGRYLLKCGNPNITNN